MKLKTVILDDELPALELIESYCKQTKAIELIARFADATQALDFIQNNSIDLLISDINMPWMSGVELKSILPENLHTIFITAHAEHAVQGFELGVVDYLLKPVMYPRFLKAINKVVMQNQVEKLPTQHSMSQFIFVKDGNVRKRIHFDDILYVQSQGDYLSIELTNSRLMILHTLADFLKLLPEKSFVRIHRSTIVNLAKVDLIEKDYLEVAGKDFTIGKTYRSLVHQRITPNFG